MSKLLGDGLGVSRVHEDILEDGGGVVTGELVKERLHEVGRHREEASPDALVALPGANRGEVLAGRPPAIGRGILVRLLLANGGRHLLGVMLGDVPAKAAWRP